MTDVRQQIRRKLHETYQVRAFDNQDVWAGNLAVELDGVSCDAIMARAAIGPERKCVAMRVTAELYLRDVDPAVVRPADIDAHLWTDVNDRGFVDERGVHHDALGRHLPMHLVTDAQGRAVPVANNLVFQSDVIRLDESGVFNYTVEFSADLKPEADPSKDWISINDISLNRDGVIVVSPEHVRSCPSITEVCVRKVGARFDGGSFTSGTFRDVTRALAEISTDVVYLLPFFEPGCEDSLTGEDVRKGSLGSVYAVRDFFRIDPQLVTPLTQVDILDLVAQGLVKDYDLRDLLDGRQQVRLKRMSDFNDFNSIDELTDWIGTEALTQIVGRAELRALTRRAHELGKRVIFDLVLMQTSRDCPLIGQHPEWYVLDEAGHPLIHQIAWLVYSDVALMDLPFNKPLQSYLSGVAPFWIRTCDLDGVRIDASQTVDRPFQKQIKNRINAVKEDALVLGETLCPLHEAVDVPADMIYALLVDYHRHADRAIHLTEFLEETFGCFARGTVAIAYFENHDSPRATPIWRRRFADLLAASAPLRQRWQASMPGADAALVMALLRNIQASAINATAGSASHVNLAWAVEWGTTWGEEAQTDFTNPTLLSPELAAERPRSSLHLAYRALHDLEGDLAQIRAGDIYFHRNEFEGGDPDDRVLAYTRHSDSSVTLAVHNLDPECRRRITCRLDVLPGSGRVRPKPQRIFDSYSFFVDATEPTGEVEVVGSALRIAVAPLQSLLVKVL